MKYTDEQKEQARLKYLAGNSAKEISEALNIELRTLYLWIKDGDWDKVINKNDVLYTISRRITLLANRENKTEGELNELDRLVGHYCSIERLMMKRADGSAPTGTTGSGESGGKKRGRKPQKNDFTDIDEEDLIEKFKEGLFEYQLSMWDERRQRIRNILKSRQIGFTFYFASEAFTDALLTGRNKIFISASRAQSDVFRAYIKCFALEWFDADLKGKDTIELHTRHGVATLYFLSTNSATAQSYHGDVYIDEYFWIPKFEKLNKVASAMASQKQWTKTYFSTPSAKSHDAYPFWSGDAFNERNKRADKPIVIFPDYDELRKGGILCKDGQYRRIITLEDAEKEGCTLFDRAQLELEYSEDEFSQLFMCKFIDDTAGVFKFSALQHCLGDRYEFPNFNPDADKPYKGPVWIGYDPSRRVDGACIVVIAVPTKHRGKFYVLEKIILKNAAWEYQAETIKELTQKYNVEHIGIDKTGPGEGVSESVQRFFPAAECIFYTEEKKTRLVLKAQQVIADKRIVWDASWSDIPAGFMQIRRGVSSGNKIVYFASRNDVSGHADAAWAIMNALIHEDFIQSAEEDPGSCVL